MIKHINQILHTILSQIIEIAEPLEEYQEAKKFSGISDKLAVQITAEFGDLSKFKNKKSLISFVGIDSPPYESGNFKAEQRKITKRGNAILRKIGYKAMKCMMSSKNPENEIYLYMVKKEKDEKAKMVYFLSLLLFHHNLVTCMNLPIFLLRFRMAYNICLRKIYMRYWILNILLLISFWILCYSLHLKTDIL